MESVHGRKYAYAYRGVQIVELVFESSFELFFEILEK